VRTLLGAIGAIVWTGAFAVVMTALVSGVWTGLLVVNLKVSPAIPWATVVMAGLLWLLWSYLGGLLGPQGADAAFWVDAALAAGCAAVSLALVIYLAKLAGRRRQTAETA
jgi:hypothetical protein